MPVVKGGVFDFYLRKLTIGVGEKDMGDFPAVTFGGAMVNAFLASSFSKLFGFGAGR